MNGKRIALVCTTAVVLVLVAGWVFGWGRMPQMGADEETFRSVDALFTAVTARDEKLLGQCEQRLQVLRATEKLPADAAHYLDGVVEQARTGRWENAARQLYDFMKKQTREGSQETSRRKPKERANVR
jgi:hypothetical protein